MVRDPVAAKVAVIATTGAVGFAASGITADVVSVAEARGAALFAVAAIAEEATTTAGFAEAGLAVNPAKPMGARRSPGVRAVAVATGAATRETTGAAAEVRSVAETDQW